MQNKRLTIRHEAISGVVVFVRKDTITPTIPKNMHLEHLLYDEMTNDLFTILQGTIRGIKSSVLFIGQPDANQPDSTPAEFKEQPGVTSITYTDPENKVVAIAIPTDPTREPKIVRADLPQPHRLLLIH